MKSVGRPFLTAEWRYLAILNFEIDQAVLAPLVPVGTEVDIWRERTFVSVVGFLFLKTRMLGMAIPFHRNFEEVNLRFYVRRKSNGAWRRGVVFVKEIVPRWAIAFTARALYNENYSALPMHHRIERDNHAGAVRSVSYSWLFSGRENRIDLAVEGVPQPIQEGSEAEFITEHYWGYARRRDGSTLEYRVEHPRWRVWMVGEGRFDGDVARLYGAGFVESLRQPPASAFLAEGSKVAIFRGLPLTSP